MHFAFRLAIDRVNSFSSDDFTPAQIDWLLNLAQLIEVDKRYTPLNSSRQGMEVTQKRTDDLSVLHVKSPQEQPGIVPVLATSTLLDNSIYECPLSSLLYDYKDLTGLRADIKSGSCTKQIGLTQVQEDYLDEALINEHTKPDFKWKTALFTISKDSNTTASPSIYVYSGDFEVLKVYPSYIKLPRKVFFSGYNSLDNQYVAADAQVNSELPEPIHRNIVDTAVELASAAIQDPEYLQVAKYKSDKFEY